MAEVQARCTGPLVDADATLHEERMTRQNARLRRQLAALREVQERSDRFLHLLAESDPAESPEEWADRAAKTWCGESAVSAARVVWLDPENPGPASLPAESRGAGPDPTGGDRRRPGVPARPPTVVLPLALAGRERAVGRVLVSLGDGRPTDLHLAMATGRAPGNRGRPCWPTARGCNDGFRRSSVRFGVRSRPRSERLRQGKLDALGEFAAGAGHELNNPLAVIVGRAQLLLARVKDAEVAPRFASSSPRRSGPTASFAT